MVALFKKKEKKTYPSLLLLPVFNTLAGMGENNSHKRLQKGEEGLYYYGSSQLRLDFESQMRWR